MVLCASATNAVMDTLATHYGSSIFSTMPSRWQQWLDPRISWHNKWKDGDKTKGEAFPLSSTSFAFTTDAWHFFKSLTVWFLWAAILAPFTLLFALRWYWWALIFLGGDILRGGVFEILFSWGLVR